MYVIDYKYAYAAPYAISVVVSYILNSLFVFNAKPSIKNVVQFPLVYFFLYVFGMATLYI